MADFSLQGFECRKNDGKRIHFHFLLTSCIADIPKPEEIRTVKHKTMVSAPFHNFKTYIDDFGSNKKNRKTVVEEQKNVPSTDSCWVNNCQKSNSIFQCFQFYLSWTRFLLLIFILAKTYAIFKFEALYLSLLGISKSLKKRLIRFLSDEILMKWPFANRF